MIKLCFIDIETTGTDPKKNGLVQLAGIIVIDGVEVDTFDFRLAPFEADIIEDGALSVNGIKREDLAGFSPPREVYREFCDLLGQHVDKFNKLDKSFFVGYNARFDADFIRAWFEKCGDVYFGSWFWFPPIDVMNLALVSLMDKRATMPNFKLATVAKDLGLEPEGALHDALTDIRLTQQLFNKLRGDNGTMETAISG